MLTRHLEPIAAESLRTFRVTVINGPRQSGKTTLVRRLVGSDGSYASLDDQTMRAAAQLDPHGFAAHGPSPMAIDEVQRGGNDLVLAIKLIVDRRNDRGQFILAGSSRFLLVPQLSESLAGRAEILDLWPLSQGELLGVTETFIDALFDRPATLSTRSFEMIDRSLLSSRLVQGGFPETIGTTASQASRWHRNYVRTVVERDIIEASAISQATEVPRVLGLIAANSSGEVVAARLAGDTRLSADTISRYLALLELVGLVVLVPAWTPSLTSREKRHPKGVISDSGLACALLGIDTDALAKPTHPMMGPLVEAFATMELIKQRSWSRSQPTIRHWRDRNGAEIDLVLENDDGQVAALEIKASSTVSTADARHLHRLRDQLADRFSAGIVLYMGPHAVPLGERTWALPISALWSGD